MLNSKLLPRANGANLPKSRSRSIYRGNKSHTASMHLKIECDLSPETVRRPKQDQSSSKQLLKQNRTQFIRDSLRIMEGTLSGKKSQREEVCQKAGKNSILIQTRHLETERTLKETTNLANRKENWVKNDDMRQERPIVSNLAANNKRQEKGNDCQIAMSQQELKTLLLAMRQLENENRRLRKEISLFLGQPNSSVARAL